MNEDDEAILTKNGWKVECESPFEIRHQDGSFATGQAAQIVLDELRGEEEVGHCSVCYGTIYVSQGRFVEESHDGKTKMYHDVCKVSLRAEEAERKLRECLGG